MNVKITPNKLNGTVYAPPSKSYAHRLMIAACLSGKKVTIKNVGESKDVFATATCLKSLGADCVLSDGNFTVNSFTPKSDVMLDCSESGSTLRFMLPVCVALGVKAKITGSAKLLSRPSLPLINALNVNGAEITANEKCIFTAGKLKGGKVEIDGSISSQYVSGLLLALSATDGTNEIKIVGNSVSENYVSITVDVLKNFGVNVSKTDCGYIVEGKSFAPNDIYFNEGDYSGAAFMLAAGAIGGSVTVKGLKNNSVQGDAQIVEIIKKFGGKVKVKGDEVTVKKSELVGTNVCCENVPDLAQIIAVLASFSKGETVISGIGRLKFKESDRIKAITDMLTVSGIKSKTDGETLTIIGGRPKGGKFFSGNDHRTAMSSAVLATFAEGESLICGAEAVSKSYPTFFDDFKLLGGKADVII